MRRAALCLPLLSIVATIIACSGAGQRTTSQTKPLPANSDPKVWTKSNRPDWAVALPAKASPKMKDLWRQMDQGFEDRDYIGISVEPTTIWVDRAAWDKLSQPDKNGILARVSLYCSVRKIEGPIRVGDAET